MGIPSAENRLHPGENPDRLRSNRKVVGSHPRALRFVGVQGGHCGEKREGFAWDWWKLQEQSKRREGVLKSRRKGEMELPVVVLNVQPYPSPTFLPKFGVTSIMDLLSHRRPYHQSPRVL